MAHLGGSWRPNPEFIKERFENQIILWRKQEGRCHYCRVPLLVQPADIQPRGRYSTIDHILPRSRGGDSKIDNLCLSCYTCNKAKGDLTEEEFREQKKTWLAKKKYDDGLNKYECIPVEDSVKQLQEKYDEYRRALNERKVQGECITA